MIGTLTLALSAIAQSVYPEITAYAQSLAAVEKTPTRQSLEPLYQKGLQAMAKIAPDIETYAHKNWDSEGYNVEKQFSTVMALMRGYQISPYEGDAVIQGTDFGFWDKLATAKGLPADATFFRLSHQQYPEYPGFSSFIQMTWDYGGCTLYGKGHLTPLYAGWKDFQKKNPERYKTEVRDNLAAVLNQLSPNGQKPICSCDGKAGLIREVKSLSEKLPQDPVTVKLRKLSKDPKVKFECHYG